MIASAEGVWLTDFNGKRYIDAVSSWWTNLFGHANPRISNAIKQQLDTLEHVILAGFTHEPVIQLSEKLAQLTGLGHAFYASDGASATEIALKMINEEGLDNVFARHHFLAEGVRAAVTQGWQLKLCAAEAKWHSDTVTAVMLPPGIAGTEVIARAYRRYNLSLGGGLSKVAGKLFRIGHLGDMNPAMILGCLGGVEAAMTVQGVPFGAGALSAAAQVLAQADAVAQPRATVWQSHPSIFQK